MSDLHDRVAKALGWSPSDVRSLSMQSLRDLVRPVDPDLSRELGYAIQSGTYIRGTPTTKRHHAIVTKDRFIPSITVGPVTRKPPSNVTFGTVYGRPWKVGSKIVWMFRRGQRVRFFTAGGREIGEEQSNVAPAVAYASSKGWIKL
jgi:hypothetical protein